MSLTTTWATPADSLERDIIRRVTWRLIPILMLGYFCASLDRANVGMAATTMSPALHFSNAQFGFGAGIFFLGYLLAEIPSNLILDRFGARLWLARIMITERPAPEVRRVLRRTEGDDSHPERSGGTRRATAAAWSRYSCPPASPPRSSARPIGGLLMHLHGLLGAQGWQWLFIIEALSSIITGFLILAPLTDRPRTATWLSPDARDWLDRRLTTERAQQEAVQTFTLKEALTNPKVWWLTFVAFGHQYAHYGLVFFMPLIVKGLGVSRDWIGTVSAPPPCLSPPSP